MRMVDLCGQYLSVKDEMDAAVGEVMRSCAFVRGPQTALLEEELAAWMGVGHCVTCGSGTDALLLAMTAIGVGRGDEVIVPAFTFGAVAETVAMRGATPVFADVDPLTFNIDSSSVERLISGRTRAVVAVHMFGQPCDMPPLFELARRHG
ncbi:MAG: aminotransferase class I/II-fold pyridoxal phosphate-dependent enzyme, partial [Paramuribaculum sp.]|nr:aminotransferase class I/II-fold pyridoxal phosphate-dependent enzyme [Paramuribaculum sp.]